jgi:hypothetical protein
LMMRADRIPSMNPIVPSFLCLYKRLKRSVCSYIVSNRETRTVVPQHGWLASSSVGTHNFGPLGDPRSL